MGYFIKDSVAQTAPAASQGASLASFVPLIILFVVFYIFLIRPQMKRQKEHTKMVRELAVGDERSAGKFEGLAVLLHSG